MLNPAAPDSVLPLNAPAASSSLRRFALTPGRYALLLCTVFMLAMFFRSPDVLLAPRMWGEEASLYFAPLQFPGNSVWTHVVRGNYQLLANVAAGIGLLLPAEKVAYATTAVGLFAALVMITLLGLLAAERGWRPWTACLAAAAIAWLPQGYEVYLNSTNVQWVASITVLLLVVLAVQDWTPRGRRWATAWLVLCAFSGVPSVTLAPVMLVRGVLARSRVHLVMGAILCVGACFQLTLVLTHTLTGRPFQVEPLIAVVGTLAQVVLGPTLGVSQVEPYLAVMMFSGMAAFVVAAIAIAVLLGWVMLRAAAASPGGRELVAFLVGATALAILVNIVGGMGVQMTAWVSGRYFILGSACWVILVCAGANSARPVLRKLAMGCLVLVAIAGASEVLYGDWKDFMRTGIPWQTMVQGCEGRRPCLVQPWPIGMGWQLQLFRP